MLKSTAVRLAGSLACAAGVLLGCGSKKSSSNGTPTVTVSPQDAVVQVGGTVQFTAEVQGNANHDVTWKVEESGGGTVGGTGQYAAPGAAGYYHVVATSAADPNVTARTSVAVRPTIPVRYVGVNLMWQAFWDETQMFADILKQANWGDSYYGQSGATVIGPDQWPASGSFRVCGIGASNALPSRPFHNGTYRVTFKGQANLQPRSNIQYVLANTTTPYSAAAAYDPGTNTTVLDAIVTDGGAGYSEDPITLDAADADRNGWPGGVAASSRNDGLTEMHMWRPGTYDPRTSQPTSYFNKPFIDGTQQFRLIRLMQTLGPAGDGVAYSRLASWSDRPLPGIMYSHLGVAYEETILLANMTGSDVWINVPLHASDEFIRNLALTFAFGSDRSTGLPFTGAYGSTYDADDNPRPATHDPGTWTVSTSDWYPPLAAGRHVYIEWSNEIWNYNNGTDETYAPSARVAATASVAAGDPWKIAWDGTSDAGVLMHRLTMAKAIQIGLEFRRALGDAACNDSGKDPSQVRVRNVFAYQAYGVSSVGNVAGTTNWIEAARDYFDHVWGAGSTAQMLGPPGYQFSNRPGGAVKPDPYYLWGASSGGYLGFDHVGQTASVDDALNWTRRAWDGYNLDGSVAYASGGVTDLQARGWGNAPYKYSMKAEHDWWWQRGIRFSLYEANHDLGATGSNDYEKTAAEDPRLANVLLSATTYLYTLPGFEAWVHFSLIQNYHWGVTPTLYSTGTYVGKTYTTALAAGATASLP